MMTELQRLSKDLYRLGKDQFQTLSVQLATKILGMSVRPSGRGADAGRDAWFDNEVQYPPHSPWGGPGIVQAKFQELDLGPKGNLAWLLGAIRSEFNKRTPERLSRYKDSTAPSLYGPNNKQYLLITNTSLGTEPLRGAYGKALESLREACATAWSLPPDSVELWSGERTSQLLLLYPKLMSCYPAICLPREVVASMESTHREALRRLEQMLTTALGASSLTTEEARVVDSIQVDLDRICRDTSIDGASQIALLDNLYRSLKSKSVAIQIQMAPAILKKRIGTARHAYGWASQEVTRSMSRLAAVFSEDASSDDVFLIFFNQWQLHTVQSETQAAMQAADSLREMAGEGAPNAAWASLALRATGESHFFTGNQSAAKECLQKALCEASGILNRKDLATETNVDVLTATSAHLGLVLALQDEESQALEAAVAARKYAEEIAHSPSTTFAIAYRIHTLQYLGKSQECALESREFLENFGSKGSPQWVGAVRMVGAWADLVTKNRPDASEAIDNWNRGFEEFTRGPGARVSIPYRRWLLAQIYEHEGLWSSASNCLSQAIGESQLWGEVYWLPELLRANAVAKFRANIIEKEDALAATRAARKTASEQGAHRLRIRAESTLAEL